MTNPAKELVGLTLEGGWTVEKMVELSPQSTGGYFSVGYFVSKADGTRAFLKALDYSRALNTPDPAKALQALTSAYNFERDVLEKCKIKKMDRVVQAVTHGKTQIEGAPYGGVVEYLIFELADGDIRTQMDLAQQFDTAWTLRSLHHIAVGLQQLHGQGIAHQDIKPSNILVFNSDTSKVSDLGRAAYKGHSSPHEDFEIPGDPSYAPPELLYGYVDPDWSRRRFGCDLYLLGSMIVFFFTGLSMTSLLSSRLDEAHTWEKWGGTFDDILPYIRDGFGQAINIFKPQVNKKLQDDLVKITRELCEPDPRFRGHPKNRLIKGNQFSVERYVSHLNLLASKAECGIFKG